MIISILIPRKKDYFIERCNIKGFSFCHIIPKTKPFNKPSLPGQKTVLGNDHSSPFWTCTLYCEQRMELTLAFIQAHRQTYYQLFMLRTIEAGDQRALWYQRFLLSCTPNSLPLSRSLLRNNILEQSAENLCVSTPSHKTKRFFLYSTDFSCLPFAKLGIKIFTWVLSSSLSVSWLSNALKIKKNSAL